MDKNPFLWPNFHSVCDKNNSLNFVYNRFAFTSQLEFNGLGLINKDIYGKHNTIANFYARSPSLPYFVNRFRTENPFAAKNCLIFCKNEDKSLLITTDDKSKIFGLVIEDNEVSNSGSSSEIRTKSHTYSADQSVSYGPFRYCTQKLCHLWADEEEVEDFRPINELKVHSDDQNSPQIQSNSRNRIRFFKFKSNEDSDLSLDPFNELKVEDLRRSDESLFENCDRNQSIDNQLLVSFTTNDFIDLYNLETNQIVRSFDSEKSDQIGLHWSQTHPMMFFNGYHKQIQYCDARSRKTVIKFFDKNNYNSHNWEMFYQILPTKLNPNQVFLATDYHILVADWRYPKRNLIQLNHMIPNTIIRSLNSLEVVNDNTNTELLVSSNFHRNCLMSFTSSENLVSLSSTHLPIHLSNPKDIDKKFEDYFYRGIQLIDSTDSSGFSLALLTNLGDMFMQDLFWCTSKEDMTSTESDPNYKDRTYCSGVGSSHLKLEPKTEQYMSAINEFLNRLDYESKLESNYVKECLHCTLHRICRIVKDECHCRRFTAGTATQQEMSEETDTPDRTQFISNLYQKHLGPQILANTERLRNKELLSQNSDKYTKKIFDVWNVFEKEPTN